MQAVATSSRSKTLCQEPGGGGERKKDVVTNLPGNDDDDDVPFNLFPVSPNHSMPCCVLLWM